jgi:hypothetical protein
MTSTIGHAARRRRVGPSFLMESLDGDDDFTVTGWDTPAPFVGTTVRPTAQAVGSCVCLCLSFCEHTRSLSLTRGQGRATLQ